MTWIDKKVIAFDKAFGDEMYPAKGTVGNYRDFLIQALEEQQHRFEEIVKYVQNDKRYKPDYQAGHDHACDEILAKLREGI